MLALTAGGLGIIVPVFTLKTQLQVQLSGGDLAVGHQHSHRGGYAAQTICV